MTTAAQARSTGPGRPLLVEPLTERRSSAGSMGNGPWSSTGGSFATTCSAAWPGRAELLTPIRSTNGCAPKAPGPDPAWYYVSTSYPVCKEVLRSRSFGVVPVDGSEDLVHQEGLDLSLLVLNPPDHTRIRRLAAPALTPPTDGGLRRNRRPGDHRTAGPGRAPTGIRPDGRVRRTIADRGDDPGWGCRTTRRGSADWGRPSARLWTGSGRSARPGP